MDELEDKTKWDGLYICMDCNKGISKVIANLAKGRCMDCYQMMPRQTIEIDCAPFTPRPDKYIDGVIEGTGLPKKDDCSRLFGNWIWDYSEIPEDEWKRIQPIFKERLTKLYNSGAIRYASW